MYARSKDDEQFYGIVKTTLASTCKEPFRHQKENYKNNSLNIPVTPCGAVANSLFNGIEIFVTKKIHLPFSASISINM